MRGWPARRNSGALWSSTRCAARSSAATLALLGYGNKASVRVEAVRFQPRRVEIGGRVSFALRSQSREAQELLVDVAVHFIKANGDAKPKVFKLKRVLLPAGGRVELQTAFSLAVHTTRVPRPGRHAVDVLVNGGALRVGSFEVLSPPVSV